MAQASILVFEDSAVDQLYPITTGRPAFAITCAGYRLVDWLHRLDLPTAGVVRDHLRAIQEVHFPEVKPTLPEAEQPLLVVNARLVPCRKAWQVLEAMVADQRFGVIRDGEQVAALLLPRTPELKNWDRKRPFSLDEYCGTDLERLPILGSELKLFEYPHDVVRYNLSCLNENLEERLKSDSFREVRDGVFVADHAKLGDYITTDTSNGPIVIDHNAQIGPYCYLEGPAYIGPKARVIEHSAIKDAVTIGHTTKIGGEVEASVVEPYTNKQHHGFLGHSYLGSWINWGAGTCNSDLKNTYGEVKMEYRNEKVATGMQFVGCIIGDYSKTAINTGIFTGKTVGVCSMLYGFVTTNVPSYVNYARSFGQVTEMTPEIMASTQRRMFQRRNVTQQPADIQLIHKMFELTRHERQLAGEPLSL